MTDEPTPTRAVLVRVTGRVQGVGFRAHVSTEADRLGLAGWVRNRDDGSVEAWAEGDPAVVDQLLDAVRSGPSSARVADVAVEEVAPEGVKGFRTR